MRIKKTTLLVFLLPSLIIFSLIYAIPIGSVFVTSFFDYSINRFSFVGFENYAQFFGDGIRAQHFGKAVLNTLIWIFLQGTVHIALGVSVALMLNRRPRGWKVVRTAYMLSNIIATAALGLIYLNVFNAQRGVVNGIIGIFTPGFSVNWFIEYPFFTVTATWLFFAGLITILALGEMMSISPEIYDAAKVDGARGLQIDFYIVIPMIRMTIGTCVILAVTSMLREVDLLFMTTNGGPGVETISLPLLIYKTAMLEHNYGIANAYGAFTIVLGIVLVVVINKAISKFE
jgi:raffinose/stachyose/melibiose transport system permease protein